MSSPYDAADNSDSENPDLEFIGVIIVHGLLGFFLYCLVLPNIPMIRGYSGSTMPVPLTDDRYTTVDYFARLFAAIPILLVMYTGVYAFFREGKFSKDVHRYANKASWILHIFVIGYCIVAIISCNASFWPSNMCNSDLYCCKYFNVHPDRCRNSIPCPGTLSTLYANRYFIAFFSIVLVMFAIEFWFFELLNTLMRKSLFSVSMKDRTSIVNEDFPRDYQFHYLPKPTPVMTTPGAELEEIGKDNVNIDYISDADLARQWGAVAGIVYIGANAAAAFMKFNLPTFHGYPKPPPAALISDRYVTLWWGASLAVVIVTIVAIYITALIIGEGSRKRKALNIHRGLNIFVFLGRLFVIGVYIYARITCNTGFNAGNPCHDEKWCCTYYTDFPDRCPNLVSCPLYSNLKPNFYFMKLFELQAGLFIVDIIFWNSYNQLIRTYR